MTNCVWNYLWGSTSKTEIRLAILQAENRLNQLEQEYGERIRDSGVYFQFYADLIALRRIYATRFGNE